MPSLGEYLGGSLQRAGSRLLPYWMDKQQLKRQDEATAFRQTEADRENAAREETQRRLQESLDLQKGEFEYQKNRNRQNDFLSMIERIEAQRMKSQPAPAKTLDEYAIRQADAGDRSLLERLLNAKTDKGGKGDDNLGGLTPFQWLGVGADWRGANTSRLRGDLGLGDDEPIPTEPMAGPLSDVANAKVDSLNWLRGMPNYEAAARYQQQLTGQDQQAPTFTSNLSALSRPQQTPPADMTRGITREEALAELKRRGVIQ